MDVEGLVRPVVEASGLELVEVVFHREQGRRVLRVTVDREGGVDLDAIAEASERIGRRLDLEGFQPGPYALEVSSPGVERPLREARDFARHVGEQARVKTTDRAPGARAVTGWIVAADLDGVRLDTEAGEVVVPYGEIASARTVFDWAEDLRTRSKGEAR